MRFNHLRRREFITLLGGAAAAWPLAVRAQEAGRVYRLGFLVSHAREAPWIVALFDELRLSGFIEGQNLIVVPDGFNARDDQLAERVAAIVNAAPDAIVSGADLATRALQQATRTIPLIGMTEDMVAAGLVDSLARPGGNTTGISLLSPELDGKRQDILMEAVPGARRMAALADSRVTPMRHLQTLQEAARARGLELSIFGVTKLEEIVPAIDNTKASGAEALNVLATPLFFANSRIIIERVTALRLPAIYQWPDMAEQGGLAGYGPRFTQIYRQRARMVVKVLRGAKPADLPVEQPTVFELVINLQAAKAIGHQVPAALVLRADKVIE
jgi:putative tryptophan/tyrosine transport system substrate-binding protein